MRCTKSSNRENLIPPMPSRVSKVIFGESSAANAGIALGRDISNDSFERLGKMTLFSMKGMSLGGKDVISESGYRIRYVLVTCN